MFSAFLLKRYCLSLIPSLLILWAICWDWEYPIHWSLFLLRRWIKFLTIYILIIKNHLSGDGTFSCIDYVFHHSKISVRLRGFFQHVCSLFFWYLSPISSISDMQKPVTWVLRSGVKKWGFSSFSIGLIPPTGINLFPFLIYFLVSKCKQLSVEKVSLSKGIIFKFELWTPSLKYILEARTWELDKTRTIR